VRPVPAHAPSFDVSYATCGDPGVAATVADRAASIAAWARRPTPQSSGPRRAAVTLTLQEARKRVATGWFGGGGGGGGSAGGGAGTPSTAPGSGASTPDGAAATRSVAWERWVLPLRVVAPGTASDADSPVRSPADPPPGAAGLEAALARVAVAAAARTDHVPPVLSPDGPPFPFDVAWADVGSGGTGLDAVRRLLRAAPPPPVLT
jgi:hypothetical protein